MRSLETDIFLSPLSDLDYSDCYLSWLNDKEVNYYSYRRNYNFSKVDLIKFLEGIDKSDKAIHFKIIAKDKNIHIGNISLTNIDKFSKFAELGILIGDKKYWGKGIGLKAVVTMVDYGFKVLNLNRIEIGTYNPIAKKIFIEAGFFLEGESKSKFMINNKYYDETRMAILSSTPRAHCSISLLDVVL